MQVGHKWWRLVSTDSAGVPHGGPYGDVETFEKEAKKHGLLLGWSRLWKCFVLFTRRGPNRYVSQFRFYNERLDKPIPLTRMCLAALMAIWERFARQSARSILAEMARIQQERKMALAKRKYEDAQMCREDVVEAVRRARGKGPKIFSLPKNIIPPRMA
jgi:hypothetical protein